ncbi:MAG: class I SAM-dependent methyltransferase [Candidatus Uhrbacteria bacterium]|nr:class I SAM-dependent methyltransferase [Candidatus Uhrbacteria bacterium]
MILRSGSELLNPFRILERVGVRERMHVADLGCGAIGHFVFPAAQMVGPKGKVYAVDILKDALDMLDRRSREDQYTNIHFVWSDIEVYRAAHIPDHSVDLVFLVNVLFFVQRPTHVVAEVSRIVKKGGKVLVIDWKPSATAIGPDTSRRLSAVEIARYFQGDCFEPLDAFDAGRAHQALVFHRTDAASKVPEHDDADRSRLA